MHVTKLLGRLRREEEGASMVEFSIVAIVLFTMIFAIIDFGRLLFLMNNLKDAARSGARFASVQFEPGGPCANAAVVTAVQDSTRRLILEFHATQTANPTVNMTCTDFKDGAPDKITIQVAGIPFRPVTPIPFVRNLTLTQSATVRYEGSGKSE